MRLGTDDALAADWVRLRELRMTGDTEQALQLAEQTAAKSDDAAQVAQALIAQLAVHHAAKHQDALLPLLERIEVQLAAEPHPRLVGEYHIFGAGIAYDRQQYGVALQHIVEAQRALHQMDERTLAAVNAWHDLAAMSTVLGYHAQALDAADRCQSLCADAGLPAAQGTAFYAQLHAAAYLDQRGDTAGCVRQLGDLVERARPMITDLTVVDRVMLAYAVRRLAALDAPVAAEVSAPRDLGPTFKRINALGDVCEALAARRPGEAIARLDAATEPLDVFGAAEPLRLRSLALAQLGDHEGALATERAMHLVSIREEGDLRRLLVNAAGAHIDQDELRRSAERHARAALTDPLTGLPNRRKVDEFTADLIRTGRTAAVGMLDLDGFKAINDRHGHPTGDLVLQRVAGILARGVRGTDLVARPGGDEFVLVLPDTATSDAQRLGQKIDAAISDEDWESIVPGTPVAVSIGWAELDSDVDAAFRAADSALYDTKRRHRSHAETV